MAEKLGPSKITAKQRACYEMRKSGSSWDEIGTALEMSPQTARGHVYAAERNGLPPVPRERVARNLVSLDPEAAQKRAREKGYQLIQNGDFDLKAFMELADAAGVPPKMALALGRRVQLNFGPVKEELRKFTLAERVEETNKKADLVLSYIDEASIAGMNAKDLAMAYGVLVDKSQLLGGKPTQIFDFNMRRKLEVLMPEFLAEARRRGITVEGEFHVEQGNDRRSAAELAGPVVDAGATDHDGK